jgi:hypothetical protein
MDHSDQSSSTIRDSSVAVTSHGRHVFRAWALLLGGFAIFLAATAVASTTAYSFVRDGTESQTATLEPVSGQSLLIRSEGEEDWRLVTERTTLQEGDMVSTGSATAGWITLFDQGTIEVSENSLVRLNRMRTSRLFREQKEIDIEPIRGSVYVGMAPRGEFSSSVLRVRAGPVTTQMRDEIRIDQTGSFLVETQRMDPSGDEQDQILSVRVAVLRGVASVETDKVSQQLAANEQIIFDPSGEPGEITHARRELIRNGDFSRDLADWVEYHDQPGDSGTDSGTIERVPTDRDQGSGVAVQISRSARSGDNWQTGIQQAVGQSLRVHSSLSLSMDVRIDEQQPIGGGDELTEFPLIARINYVDLQGQTREWWHGFYILDDISNPVPVERGTRVSRGEWTTVNLDLRNLSPLPRQISSIVVYSSGHNYRSFVTNLSLTSSETGDDAEYD